MKGVDTIGKCVVVYDIFVVICKRSVTTILTFLFFVSN